MGGGLLERDNQPSFKDSGGGTVLSEVTAHSLIISPDIIREEWWWSLQEVRLVSCCSTEKTATVWVDAVYVALSTFSGLTGDFHSWVLPLHFASRPPPALESSAAGDGLLTPCRYRTNLWDRSQNIAQLRTNTGACTSQQYHIYIVEQHAKSQSCGGNHRICQQIHWS